MTNRTPQIDEIWTHRSRNTTNVVTIKAIDSGLYWVKHTNGKMYTMDLSEVLNHYNPPKVPLREIDRSWFPAWLPLVPGDSRLYSDEETAKAVASRRRTSSFVVDHYPVLRIDGVDENGKFIGEQIL